MKRSAFGILAGSVTLVALLAAAIALSAPAAAPKGSADNGAKLFKAKACATCHKADGTGGVKLTGNPTPNWKDAKLWADPKHDDAYLRDCLTNGKLKSGMQAWGKSGLLKPAEIEDLIAYIHQLAGPALKGGKGAAKAEAKGK